MGEAMQVNRRGRGRVEKAQAEQKIQYLAFELGGEAFGMAIRSIKEVIQYGDLTGVPLMPAFLRGVINLRGAVVPVVDLAVRFGRPPTDVARRTCIVILEVEQDGEAVELGIIVDNVSEVLELGASDLEPPPSFGGQGHPGFLAGVGKVGEKFVILLDVDHLLSSEELAAVAGEEEAP